MAVMGMTLAACGDDNDKDEPGGGFNYVGIWSVEFSEGWGMTMPEDYFEYMQLKSDGSCIDVQQDEDEELGYYVQYGDWSVSNNNLNIHITTGLLKGTTWTYNIVKKEKNKMTVSMLGVTGYLVRVNDSVIDQYLD